MTASVIIPTYNGGHKIGNLLQALAVQTVRDFEIIVVIDGSTDGTAALLRTLQPSYPTLRIIEQVNGGRAKVRNRGAKEATGELLIFFDDDMRPHPRVVQQHMEHHAAYPGSIITGGAIEEITPGMKDFARFKGELSRKWSESLISDKPMANEDQAWLAAANFSVAASTFQALGGFDERLTDGEDHDLSVRAYRMGISLYVDPKIEAWHDDLPTCAGYIRRRRQYTEAHKKLAAVKPELYGTATKYTATLPTGLKAQLFSMFCSRALIDSIDKDRWKWLPKNLRYRLYDWTITANGTFFPEKTAL